MVTQSTQAGATQAGARSTDFYQILQLHPSADGTMVDQAYWRLARLYNAAIPSEVTAITKLDDLNEAYRVLGSSALRKEYDRSGHVDQSADVAPPAPRPSADIAPAAPRPGEPLLPGVPRLPSVPRQKTQLWQPDLALPKLDLASWLVVGGALSVLVLAGAALFAGAHPALVFPSFLIVVAPLAFSFLHRLPAGVEREWVASRKTARPANLGPAPIPGGRSQAVRKLVYQVYEEFPHLGTGDVRAVARYAVLTQRFTRGERQLQARARTTGDGEWQSLILEQRALAAELRRHEAALGITAAPRASRAFRAAEPAPLAGKRDPSSPVASLIQKQSST